MRSAPTRIEVIGSRPRTEPHDYVVERIAAQGSRPVRTHATVLAASDIEAVRDRLVSSGVRHRVTPASDDFPFSRIWVGVTADEPTGYDPSVDGGLWAEVVPTSHSGIPAPPDVHDAEPADALRIDARRFLVADLDAAVRSLDSALGLVPDPVSSDSSAKYARYDFAFDRSAGIELVQPLDPDDELGRFVSRWGAGPHAIVLSVGDLGRCEEELVGRGAEPSRTSRGTGDERLLLPATATCGTPFEIVQRCA
ncbi:VOC family protein [Pseudonocardia xishanensis]